MKVYAIMTGLYDDIVTEGIFSTAEKAQEVIDRNAYEYGNALGEEPRIKEHELDSLDPVDSGDEWAVCIPREPNAPFRINRYDMHHTIRSGNAHVSCDYFWADVKAGTAKEAFELAQRIYANWLASGGQWPAQGEYPDVEFSAD